MIKNIDTSMVLEIDSTTKEVTLKNEDMNKVEQKWKRERVNEKDQGYVRFRNGDYFLTAVHLAQVHAFVGQEALHENCKYLFKTQCRL